LSGVSCNSLISKDFLVVAIVFDIEIF